MPFPQDEENAAYQLHRLCQSCKNIFSHSPTLKNLSESEQHVLHHTYDDLLNSAAAGCHFCSLMSSELRGDRTIVGRILGPITLKIVKQTAALLGNFDIKCSAIVDSQVQPTATVSLKITETPGMYKKPARIHTALSQAHTGSADHTSLAQFWVQSCITKHSCGAGGDLNFLPTRLLKISGRDQNLRVQLHITQNPRDIGLRYCCLSHCWGNAKDVLRLKKDENFANFQEFIPLENIPATYHDAILIAQSIGIEYLWIDSLCIIQDSGDDWAKESATMASIYENSYCTIAAAAAENCLDGCYVSRNPLTCGPCRIIGTEDQGLYVHPAYNSLGSLEEMEKTSTLFKRAWIFQERMLSPRVLYFGRKGICFTCRLGHAYESDMGGHGHPSGAGSPFEMEGIWRSAVASFKWVTHNQLASGHVTNILHYVWFDIVYEYSALAMSVPGDKLVALSGIAERIRSHNGEEYLAGLWKSTLIFDLLWFVSRNHQVRPLEFRAPSWSWASIEGEIVSHDPGSIDGLELIPMATLTTADISAHPADRYKTGQIYFSSLEMTGLIKRAPLVASPGGTYMDTEELVLNSRVIGKVRIDALSEPKSEAYLMPLMRTKENEPHKHWKDGYWCQCGIAGLFLHKGDKGFLRVGLFSLEVKDCEDADIFDSFVSCYFNGCQEDSIIFIDGRRNETVLDIPD